MARHSNLYGSAPIAHAQGGGGGGGGNRHHNGGGGGGGTKVTDGPLYGDKPGQGYANNDPETFFRTVMGQLGFADYGGTNAGDYYEKVLLPQLMAGYQTAQGLNRNTSATDWLRNTYGAGWDNGAFNAGSLASQFGTGSNSLLDYTSNLDPYTAITSAFTNSGGFGGDTGPGTTGGTGSPEYMDWYKNVFEPEVQQEALQRQQADPNFSINDYLKDNDLVSRANTEFAGYSSTANPTRWMSNLESSQGGIGASGTGNLGFQDYLNAQFNPGIQGEFNSAVVGNPNLKFNDWLGNRDFLSEARRAYANRPDALRAPGPAPVMGRWSWWD